MLHNIKNFDTTLKCWCKGDPIIGFVTPMFALLSVEKNSIKCMKQRFSRCQLITREKENLGSNSSGNPDTSVFSVACEEFIR